MKRAMVLLVAVMLTAELSLSGADFVFEPPYKSGYYHLGHSHAFYIVTTFDFESGNQNYYYSLFSTREKMETWVKYWYYKTEMILQVRVTTNSNASISVDIDRVRFRKDMDIIFKYPTGEE